MIENEGAGIIPVWAGPTALVAARLPDAPTFNRGGQYRHWQSLLQRRSFSGASSSPPPYREYLHFVGAASANRRQHDAFFHWCTVCL
jgi:hypothetical protein